MNHNIVNRRFKAGDEEKVNELLAIVFDGWNGKDFWQWKYEKNPAGFYRNIWLSEDAGKVVGYYALIPVKIKVNDELIMGAQSVDTATHPDYRRQRLFVNLAQTTLSEAVEEGIHITYGFPGRKSYGGFIKLGWHDLGSIPRHYRILRVGKILKRRTYQDSSMKANPLNPFRIIRVVWKILRKQELTPEENYSLRTIRFMLLLSAAVLSNLRGLFNYSKAGQIHGLTIKQADRFDERVTSFWKEISQNYPVAVDRNCEYLNWRYAHNPVNKYVIFLAESEDKIQGYTVLKCEGDEGIVMDIISQDNQVFSYLLYKALQYFNDKGMTTVECWMPDKFPHTKILKKFGFGSYQWLLRWMSRMKFMKGLTNPFILYINSPDAKRIERQLQQLDSWFLSAGDSDWEEMSQLAP